MNTTLQKRIEEAARNYADSLALPECDKRSIHAIDFKKGAIFALQNQWISVEEALPEDCENVFVRNEFGKCTSAWLGISGWHLCYGEIAGDDRIDSKITHWCPIPQLKGGEE